MARCGRPVVLFPGGENPVMARSPDRAARLTTVVARSPDRATHLTTVVARSPDRATQLTEGLQRSMETCGRQWWSGQETRPQRWRPDHNKAPPMSDLDQTK